MVVRLFRPPANSLLFRLYSARDICVVCRCHKFPVVHGRENNKRLFRDLCASSKYPAHVSLRIRIKKSLIDTL